MVPSCQGPIRRADRSLQSAQGSLHGHADYTCSHTLHPSTKPAAQSSQASMQAMLVPPTPAISTSPTRTFSV